MGLEDRPLPGKGPWSRWVPDLDHLDDRGAGVCDDHDNCSYDNDNRCNDNDNRCNATDQGSYDDNHRGNNHHDAATTT